MILYFMLVTLIIYLSVSGLLLGYTGLFSSLPVIPFLCIVTLLLGLFFFKKQQGSLQKKSFSSYKKPENILLFVILLGAALLYFHPHEYLDGGWDPGTYVNTGVHLARTGSLVYQDTVLKKMESKDLKIFLKK